MWSIGWCLRVHGVEGKAFVNFYLLFDMQINLLFMYAIHKFIIRYSSIISSISVIKMNRKKSRTRISA